MKYWLIFLPVVLTSCRPEKKVADQGSQAVKQVWHQHSPLVKKMALGQRSGTGTSFSRLSANASGIDFQNKLEEENVKNYLLNGAGMTVGDFDNDGLPDLFLVCQDGPNKLYRQTSHWKFQDVSEQAGIQDHQAWGCGATFADMNNDGYLDLIVCNKGKANEFYQNNGNGTFTGGLFALARPENSSPTIAAPADYDRDGDLDLYVAGNRLFDFKEIVGHQIQVNQDINGRRSVAPPHDQYAQYNEANILIELGTQDLLVRNDGAALGQAPNLSSVAYAKSGMSSLKEHGLAAVWFDVNNDQWPDLYVSNDFSTPDYLYLNKGGVFDNVIEEMVAYTSFYSMGSDFADINNDGFFDYFSTDMSSTTHYKQKTMMGLMEQSSWFLDNLIPRQQMRNVLHVNTGTGKFLATEFFSHLDSTDWTWSALFGDLDNDGLEDLYVTNGLERNVQNADMAQATIKMNLAGVPKKEIQEYVRTAPRLSEQNLAFRNLGDLHFENTSNEWGLTQETVSHGAVLADLDRDGDLDIVANGMNEPLLLLRNDSAAGQSILVSLVGRKSNRFGLGARIVAVTTKAKHSRIITASRGYASSGEPIAHFGLGEEETIHSLTIYWPSGVVQKLQNLSAGYHYRVTENPEIAHPNPAQPLPGVSEDAFFSEVPASKNGLSFVHRENKLDDFQSQPLLPNKISHFGPALTGGDFDGNGLDDFFVGGAAGSPGRIFLQQKDGTFVSEEVAVLQKDRMNEDVAATSFDANGDGRLDLYVVSGGNHSKPGHARYQDRLYLNQDNGNYVSTALPEMTMSGGAVAAADLDQDGDLDLFVAARITPQNYPLSPTSHVLLNDGKGNFHKGEAITGMISDVELVDIDGDSWIDLVLAQEWGPVSIWKNKNGSFENIDQTSGLAELTGWWNNLSSADIDGDGDLDFVACNFGLNNKYHATPEHPAILLAADFGGGRMNLVEAIHEEGKVFPVRGKSCSTNAMPFLAKRFPTFHDFALADIKEIYDPAKKEGALELSAKTLATQIILNNGDGTFSARPLPTEAQLAPSFGSLFEDVDGDGSLDLILAQNFYHPQRETGRMNACLNLLLMGDSQGNFTPVWPAESGLNTRDDSRSLLMLKNGANKLLISAPNDGPLRSFRLNPKH